MWMRHRRDRLDDKADVLLFYEATEPDDKIFTLQPLVTKKLSINPEVTYIRVQPIAPENAFSAEQRVHENPGERGGIVNLFARLQPIVSNAPAVREGRAPLPNNRSESFRVSCNPRKIGHC